MSPDLDGRAGWRELSRLAGWIDGARREAGGWRLDGWALLPRSGPLETIRVHWNGEELGVATPTDRPDVAEQIYWMRGVRESGFSVKLREHDDAGRLDLIGERGGRPLARLSTAFITPDRESAVLPPAPLAERVSDVSGDAFRLSGLQSFTDLWDQIRRYVRDPRDARVLDWGCGCGRVARYMAGYAAELLGCDIDAEAIQWCAENLEGRFSLSTPQPPLRYGTGEVDVVYASSLFTHLARDEQLTWLGELRRVLSPDGVLVASVAGEYALLLGQPHRLKDRSSPGSILHRAAAFRRAGRLRRAGILDAARDSHLDGIAPPGYYRSVFQTREHTTREWSGDFEIVDYIERGLNGHQDLVVMRPRGDGVPAARAHR